MPLNADVLNAQEAANLLGAHVETIRRLARKGSLPAYKVGKDWRFNRVSLLSWSQAGPISQKKATLLAVDADPQERTRMHCFLENAGYRVILVADGKQGLVRIQEHPVDLVLLNLNLTGMPGPAFIREIRTTHSLLPLIVVAGRRDSRLMFDTYPYGPFMVVPKPIEQASLVAAVRMTLEGTLSKRQAPQ
jgi:excisionase family DNA binding protein